MADLCHDIDLSPEILISIAQQCDGHSGALGSLNGTKGFMKRRIPLAIRSASEDSYHAACGKGIEEASAEISEFNW